MAEFDLEAALRRWPLPENIADEVLNRGQCAKALGVSEPIVSKYLTQGMPVLSTGSNGQAYEFQASHVYAWKMDRDERLRIERKRSDDAARQMALLFRNEDEDDAGAAGGMSTQEIEAQAAAIYRYDKAREQRRELVRRDRVEALFDVVLSDVRNQYTSAVDWAEMEFGLTGDQVTKLNARFNVALEKARAALTEHCPPETGAPVVSISGDESGLA